MKTSIVTRWAAAAAVAVASLVAAPASPASANPAGSNLIINEIYPNGGSGGGVYKLRYYELYNPTNAPINVNGWSLQYRSALSSGVPNVGSFGTVAALGDKTIPAGKHLLVSGPGNANNANDLPTADVTSTIGAAAAGGTVALVNDTVALTGDRAAVLADANLVDLVGYGSSTTYEGSAAAPVGAAASSISRSVTHVDTDDNAANFAALNPADPCNLAGCPVVEPPADPTPATIAEIQGEGATSPFAGDPVTTRGVVTAAYKTGGYSGAFIQTPGTGGSVGAASHGVFVFSSAFAAAVSKGDYVEVTGDVVEFGGTTAVPQTLTEITTATGKFTVLDESVTAPVPTEVTFPLSTAQKEKVEGMLVAPQGGFTITNNFSTNQFAEIGLAPGDEPLDTPTNVVAPGAAAVALQAKNAEDLVTLDDGASTNFLTTTGTALPWLTRDNEIRVGQGVTFDDPVVMDFRNSLWKLQPTEQLLAGGDEPVTFGPSTRDAAPQDVGGDVTVGTFNVLNYFTKTAEEYDAEPGNVCLYFKDRDGVNVTADECGSPASDDGNGPRGAANAAALKNQQDKIVKAINTLDADVVSLEEIENSIKFGEDRDAALDTLVAALNATPGNAGKWAAAPSPADLPDLAGQDLIRTAFIYQPAAVSLVGESTILDVPAFANAREPLAQAFKVTGGGASSTFAVIVNHFKSKGSGTLPGDADQGDGQGASNASRVAQATALVDFAEDVAADAGTDKIFLTGDFNSYNKEDPVRIIEEAGFVNVAVEKTDKETYQFGGAVGSLDHVFASDAAFSKVSDADIWNINSYESVAREYSRKNYNLTDFFVADSPFRASDHDPEIVGFDVDPSTTTVTAKAPATVRSGQDVTASVQVAADGGSPTGDVTITEGGTQVGTGTLADGAVDVVIDSPAIGSHSYVVSYAGDANNAPATTTLQVVVLKAEAGLQATAEPSTYGTGGVVEVTAAPGVSGLVYVSLGDDVVGMGTLLDGAGSVKLSSTIPVGTNELGVFYAGNLANDPDSTSVSLTVAKAASTIKKVSVSPTRIVKGRTKPYVELSVKAPGFTVDGGTVTVRASGKTYTGTVRSGTVRIRLGVFTSSGSAKTVTAKYAGNGFAKPSSTSFTVKVLKK
ncbi:ExeM/NucH family extracellular endonuclease [Aeromicrobium stalagmiti]|uniref:ExeM/NucH family extracellular endonuclease n=1 Tax=Aeromicrobium stalagmiti TaxID=2738988 RepID=UPI0015695A84|nr:ExeM/NucH family extracellular endonuclease [Aeromicrobium stalagmiti]NRQ49864.1 ExeM/NucH family extracellular endonuclease [Aeromicrobium stalagmiti]